MASLPSAAAFDISATAWSCEILAASASFFAFKASESAFNYAASAAFTLYIAASKALEALFKAVFSKSQGLPVAAHYLRAVSAADLSFYAFKTASSAVFLSATALS